MTDHRKQSGPGQRPPWGPHCRLGRGRHPAPYGKRREGLARRLERLHKLRQRERLLASGRERDDGYFPLGD